MSRPRIGEDMRLLRCLNSFDIAKPKTFLEGRNRRPGQLVAVLTKP
jgi:hypothetical protein